MHPTTMYKKISCRCSGNLAFFIRKNIKDCQNMFKTIKKSSLTAGHTLIHALRFKKCWYGINSASLGHGIFSVWQDALTSGCMVRKFIVLIRNLRLHSYIKWKICLRNKTPNNFFLRKNKKKFCFVENRFLKKNFFLRNFWIFLIWIFEKIFFIFAKTYFYKVKNKSWKKNLKK